MGWKIFYLHEFNCTKCGVKQFVSWLYDWINEDMTFYKMSNLKTTTKKHRKSTE